MQHLHLPADFAEMIESDNETGYFSDGSSISTVRSINVSDGETLEEIRQMANELDLELGLYNQDDDQLLDDEVDNIDDSSISSDDDHHDVPGDEDLENLDIWNLWEMEVWDKSDIDPWNLDDDLFLFLLL